MIYMVCYDITDTKRLRNTAKVLESYGIRVQKSFFQCKIEKNKLEELINRLLQVINIKKDFLYIYPLCEDCNRNAITDGKGEILKIETYEIL
ncbi:MAG: CRISPR-associated endonuclease Cas2 [Candidatus Jordarchaeum sp.]|uniref:CRISPR-associated endonuclease Cas2 n=1 Tax=Candidatus Jordarchaeum sp. TaxID=2823881 RepID=UPI00404912E9